MEKMKYLILKVSEANGLILNPDEPSLLVTHYSSLLLLFAICCLLFTQVWIGGKNECIHRSKLSGRGFEF